MILIIKIYIFNLIQVTSYNINNLSKFYFVKTETVNLVTHSVTRQRPIVELPEDESNSNAFTSTYNSRVTTKSPETRVTTISVTTKSAITTINTRTTRSNGETSVQSTSGQIFTTNKQINSTVSSLLLYEEQSTRPSTFRPTTVTLKPSTTPVELTSRSQQSNNFSTNTFKITSQAFSTKSVQKTTQILLQLVKQQVQIIMRALYFLKS